MTENEETFILKANQILNAKVEVLEHRNIENLRKISQLQNRLDLNADTAEKIKRILTEEATPEERLINLCELLKNTVFQENYLVANQYLAHFLNNELI